MVRPGAVNELTQTDPKWNACTEELYCNQIIKAAAGMIPQLAAFQLYRPAAQKHGAAAK